MMRFAEVEHGSSEYRETVELRRRVLRLPLGLDFSDAELEAEHAQRHFAAYRNSELVGCLILVPVGRSLKMRQVAVSADHQRTGVGREMVEASEAFAQEEGFEEIVLHARETAVPFYRALGYEVIGEPFEEVGLPHRKMRKATLATP